MLNMADGIGEPELVEMEQRAIHALDAAPAPWIPLLETRHGLGGESFIQFGDDPRLDQEMYITVDLGSQRLNSPDARLDAVIDFIAHASEDVPRLVAEIRRLRS